MKIEKYFCIPEKTSVHEMAIITYVLGFSRDKGPSAPRNKYPRWVVGNKVSKQYNQRKIHEIFQQNTHRLTRKLSKNQPWARSSCFEQIYLVGRNRNIIPFVNEILNHFYYIFALNEK